MSEHTKEPWKVGETTHEDGEFIETAISALDGSGWVAVCLDFGFNNPDMREANARRIVACVNACAGIQTGVLETLHDKTLNELFKREAAEYQERIYKLHDALIAAMDDIPGWFDLALAAIAEIEASK